MANWCIQKRKRLIGYSIHFHYCRLHQLFLEERIENACTDPARLVKLKKRQLDGSAVETKSGRSYMEEILERPSPDHKMVRETSITPLPVKSMSDDTCEQKLELSRNYGISPMRRSMGNGEMHSSLNEHEIELNSYTQMDRTNGYLVKEPEQISSGGTDEMPSKHHNVPDETELEDDDDEQNKREFSLDRYHSDDAGSEADDYMDALATIDSDLEVDNECRPKKSLLNVQKVTDSYGEEEHQLQAQFSDSQSFGDSSLSEEISSFEQDRSEEHDEVPARLPDSHSAGTYCASDDHSLFQRDSNEEHTQPQAQFSDSQSIGNSSSETENMSSNQLPHTVESQKTCDEFFSHYDDAHDNGRAISDSGSVSSGTCPVDSGCLLLSLDHGATATSLAALPTKTQSDETPHVANHSNIEVMQTESLNEDCSEISVVGDIGSREENPICLPMEVDLNLGTKLLLDDRDFKSDNDNNKAMQLDSEDSFPVLETNVETSFTEELCSDFTHGNPQDEPDSAEVEILYPDQLSNFKEVPMTMLGDEINGPTCSLDTVEDDDRMKHPASPDCILQDDYVMVNNMFPVTVQSKDLDVSAVSSFDSADTGASIANCLASDSISSPSMNPSNLHESLLGSKDSYRMEIESIDLTKVSVDLNAEKKEYQLEPFSYITSPVGSLTKLEESLSTFEYPHEKKMEVNEEVARDSLTELTSHTVVEQPDIASTDKQLNLNKTVPSDSSDSGICNDFQHSLPKEKIQDGSPLNDMKMATQCSELDSGSESVFACQNDLQNSKNGFSPPSYNRQDPESHIEFTSEVHPEEPSHCYLSMSSDQKINPTKHVMDPMKPLLPDLFPKETKINLEETPPMPPLPPMQWITSKVQNASSVSQREETGVSQTSFQPVQPVKPDYNSQFGLSTSERVTSPYHNPFLPAVAVGSNKSLHSSGLSVGVSEYPVAIPLQFPVMVNEANGQHNYQVPERSQVHNPFLTLPMLSYGWLRHGSVIASEGESILISTPCPQILPAECAVFETDPIHQQEKLTQLTNQFMEDTSLEAQMDRTGESVLDSSPSRPILPTECAVPGADPIFQQDKPTQSFSQIMEDTNFEAKKDSPGELHFELPAECPVSVDDSISPKEQDFDSPNQIMEETVLEFTTLDESSIDLVRNQGDHLVSPESPPSTEIVQPNHSMQPSEGDLALSLDKSAQSLAFDSQIPNGKSKNKLPPPPHNHLFDVVAALDKSRVDTVFLFFSNLFFMWSLFLHHKPPLFHCS